VRQADRVTVVSVIRIAGLAAQPWSNGLGRTVELVRLPGTDEWSLRVSAATIPGPAPFSALPGIDRVLIPLAPITLEVDGVARHLERHEPLAFRGESEVRAVDVCTPLQVLNLMTRRPAATRVELLQGTSLPVDGVVVALEPVAVDGVALARLDVAVTRAHVRIDGSGQAAVVHHEPGGAAGTSHADAASSSSPDATSRTVSSISGAR
jgi:environmental stress-induced protein Ves